MILDQKSMRRKKESKRKFRTPSVTPLIKSYLEVVVISQIIIQKTVSLAVNVCALSKVHTYSKNTSNNKYITQT